MTMTDTEAKAQALVSIDPKALEHACLCAGRSVHHFDRMGDDLPLRASIVAHARAIERLEATEARHAAELREQAERFSEVAVKVNAAIVADNRLYAQSLLAPFILPAPDPLVEEEDPIDALVDLLAPVLTHSQGMAARERENRFRNALAALKARGV